MDARHDRHKLMAITAKRHEVCRLVVVVILIHMVDLELREVFGNEPAPLTAILEKFPIPSLI